MDKRYATQSFCPSCSKTSAAKGLKPTKKADLNPWPAPFDQTFYLIMNVAVAGQFVGKPDWATAFPAEILLITYGSTKELGGKTKPRRKGKLPFGSR